MTNPYTRLFAYSAFLPVAAAIDFTRLVLAACTPPPTVDGADLGDGGGHPAVADLDAERERRLS